MTVHSGPLGVTWIPGMVSAESRLVWPTRGSTSNLLATTTTVGARPSTRREWSTRRRARPALGGSGRRGARRSGRRGRLCTAEPEFRARPAHLPKRARSPPVLGRFSVRGEERPMRQGQRHAPRQPQVGRLAAKDIAQRKYLETRLCGSPEKVRSSRRSICDFGRPFSSRWP